MVRYIGDHASEGDIMNIDIHCESEYGELRRVILCPPRYMRIEQIINETQREFAEENIDTDIAMGQHRSFTEALGGLGVEVILLPPQMEFPEQVYTRDIGFVIGDTLYVSNMSTDIRDREVLALTGWLRARGIPYTRMENQIEGGDVIIDRGTVWVGLGSRTIRGSVEELARKCPGCAVKAVPYDNRYLHLDCVFNIVSEGEALIYPAAFDGETLDMLRGRYDCIEVGVGEQFSLGTNVLSVGNRTLVGSPSNPVTNRALRERGYTVIEVDVSEILKSGGAFRCMTLPLLRS